MQYTTNYNLAKPQASDTLETASRTALNTSMDTIDTQLKTNANNITSANANITSLDTRVDTIDTRVDTIDNRLNLLEDRVFGNLLWTNASPSSNFAGQTISLDLSTYNFILIESRLQNNTGTCGCSIIRKGNTDIISITDIGWFANYIVNVARVVTSTNSEVTISSANNIKPNSRTEDNSCCIPIKIWGIK